MKHMFYTRMKISITYCTDYTSRFLLTGYVGLIKHSTTVATAVVVPLKVK